MKKGTFILAIVASILLSSCSILKTKSSSKSAKELSGTWVLTYITGPRIAFDGLYPEKKPVITIDAEKGEINGNTSCNSFGGKLAIEKNTFDMGNAHATMMACPGNGEQVFLSTLDKVKTYKVKGETLSLYMDDIEMMRFVKQK